MENKKLIDADLELTEKDEEEIQDIEDMYAAAKMSRAELAEEFGCDIEDVDEVFEEMYPGETIDD
jgi:uncharacterized protein (DUF433 family)